MDSNSFRLSLASLNLDCRQNMGSTVGNVPLLDDQVSTSVCHAKQSDPGKALVYICQGDTIGNNIAFVYFYLI